MQKYIVSLLTYSVAALCDVNRNSKQQRQLERRQDGGEKLFVVMVVGDSADIIRWIRSYSWKREVRSGLRAKLQPGRFL